MRSLLPIILIIFLSFHLTGNANSVNDTEAHNPVYNGVTYPVPSVNSQSLFYIQRSRNTNAIVYEINPGKDGKPDPVEPLRIYWIRYSTDSTMADLTYIQKNYAYGVRSSLFNNTAGQYVITFVSYDKKKLYLLPDGRDGRYKLFTSINGKMAVLERVFITIRGGTFWFPNIEDIELSGHDPESLKPLVEHLKP